MKTTHCTHPPHHLNGFVATCSVWTTSGGVHALLVLEPIEWSTSIQVMRRMGALDCLHDSTIYMYIYLYIYDIYKYIYIYIYKLNSLNS